MAASDALPIPRKNTAWRMYVWLRKKDGTLLAEAWTGADTELSGDGGAFGPATNEIVQIGITACGYIDLIAAELNYDAVNIKTTVTNADADTILLTVYPEEVGDIRANAAQINGSSQDAIDLADFASTGYDPDTNKVTGIAGIEADLTSIEGKIDALPAAAGVNVFNDETYDTDGVAITQGSIQSGTPANTLTIGTPLVFVSSGSGIDVNFEFACGTGRASELVVTGFYNGAGGAASSKYADIYFWDYLADTPAWVVQTDGSNRIPHGTADVTRLIVISPQFQDPDTGTVKVRYVSSRTNNGDTLTIDQHFVAAVNAGATLSEIASAVWSYVINASAALDGTHTRAAWFQWVQRPIVGGIDSINGNVLTCVGDRFNSSADYTGHTIQFHLGGTADYRFARIEAHDGADITVDALPAGVDDTWHFYVLPDRTIGAPALNAATQPLADDLNTITGADGVVLSTLQPNYAPAKAADEMSLTAATLALINDGVSAELSDYDVPNRTDLGAAVLPLAQELTLQGVANNVTDVLADTSDMQPKIGTPVDLGDGATVAANLTALAGKTAGAASYDRTTDSQEAIFDGMISGSFWSPAEQEQIRTALGIDGDKAPAVGGDLQSVLDAANEIKAILGIPGGASMSDDIAAALLAIAGIDVNINDSSTGLQAIKAAVDAVPADTLSQVIDGSATLSVALKKVLAYCSGKILRIGNVYTYRNFNDNADEMVLTGSSTERTRA